MADATHVVYSVPSISCDHCRRAIEGAVGAVAGVEGVTVDVAAKTVDVSLATAEPASAVRAAIEAEGYEVVAEEVVDQ